MIDSELKKQLKDIFKSQLVAVLSTSSEGLPYSCLVSFRFTDDLQRLIFATKRARLKYNKMKANPNVSLIIDNRQNRPEDFKETTAITVIGKAEDTTEPERIAYANLLLEKHPYLSDFVRSKDTAIMCVQVEKMYIVTDFEKVVTI